MRAETAMTPEPDATIAGGEAVRRPATDAERRALASVLRLRILRLCLYESLTNKELADHLSRDPASVLHHVRTLLNQGFLRSEAARPGPRGSTEVPYRATGKSWQLDFRTPEDGSDSVDPAPIGRGPDDVLLRTFLEEVAQVPQHEVRTTRLGLKLSAEHRAEFGGRMQALLDEFMTRGPDEDGRQWSVFVAVHPQASNTRVKQPETGRVSR